jgi:hypothetical protein
MKRSDQDRLLREVLADENLAHLRERSLAAGLASLRQRRRRRSLLATAASLALMLTALIATRRQSAIPPEVVVAPVERPHVKLISDEELFALFPRRATALIGPPGAQKFVFLDSRETPPSLVEK